MDVLELIKKRYSCKKFAPFVSVEEEKLNTILNAANLAPTAKNSQPQRIYVIKSAAGLAKIDSVTPCRYKAPVVIVVSYDQDEVYHYPGGRYDSGPEDCAIVATHMMLAAKAEGLDTCWVNRFDPDELRKRLGLRDEETVVMMLDIGYPAEGTRPLENHGRRKELRETVTYL